MAVTALAAVAGGTAGASGAPKDSLAEYHALLGRYAKEADSTPGTSVPEPDQAASWGTPTGTDYPKLGGNLGNTDYSSLTQINTGTVNRLGGAWETQLEQGNTPAAQESTPIVSDGVMYVQTTQQDLYALDATTGTVKWEYKSGYPAQYPNSLRGATVGDGLVFSSFGQEHVTAIDPATGKAVWNVQLGNGDYGLPEAMDFYDGKLFVGTSNGGGSGGRATVFELNARTGAVIWSLDTTPGPGQPGNDTWAGNSWAVGGSDAWMHPAVDPDAGLVYWTFGDPESRSDGSTRAGDDDFSDSLVAVDIATGKVAWHYQSVHHDIWDYDNVMAPVLANIHVSGKEQPAVFYGSKSGTMFVLNRLTGKPILGVDEVPVPQDPAQKTAATQPFPVGQPYVPLCPTAGTASEAVPGYQSGCIFTPFDAAPVLSSPGTGGAANWGADSFDPQTGLLYIGASLVNSAHTNGSDMSDIFRPEGEKTSGRLVALDPRTNTVAWKIDTDQPASEGEGIVTTAGGLLLQGQTDGQFVIRDVRTGQKLWSFQTGAGINTTATTYSVDGTQYMSVFAGGDTIGTTSPVGANLWTFKLGGTVKEGASPQVPTRITVPGAKVYGATEHDTVTLGRDWQAATGQPGTTEDLYGMTAESPANLVVPPGTKVTFTNPAGNKEEHGAQAFFDPRDFSTGLLRPGQSATVKLTEPGTYYYHDPAHPQSTGTITVADD
ncbi:putative glucose dehydrogenase [Actinacidiphila reveromycinica]|uniref:Putative glucose dehydrogenase n=1 Tax=Actinacidiphila reveromycinica TaxID=659352 RepID=A0A7U3UPN1_9ACTN|nr:putative glucose dehydrogenase [Streptomyces sp. SN-593]